jgi:protein-S-isoprenylcysteine O-methyltransferase Ste14
MAALRSLLVVVLGLVFPALFVVALPFLIALATPPHLVAPLGLVRYLAFAPWFAGTAMMVWSAGAFMGPGGATPTSADPPSKLLGHGLYRHVRNPMYVGALLVVVGTLVWTGSLWLLLYAAAMFASLHAFVIAYEEPRLRTRFGAPYEAYRANVPRWVPRLTPA